MNIWKYLIAASLGNMIAGPLGALAFTAGAYFLGKKTNFRNPGANFNSNQGVYALGLVVLCAKLAKADGRVTDDEIRKFKKIFKKSKSSAAKIYPASAEKTTLMANLDFVNDKSILEFKII